MQVPFYNRDFEVSMLGFMTYYRHESIMCGVTFLRLYHVVSTPGPRCTCHTHVRRKVTLTNIMDSLAVAMGQAESLLIEL